MNIRGYTHATHVYTYTHAQRVRKVFQSGKERKKERNKERNEEKGEGKERKRKQKERKKSEIENRKKED